MFPAKIRGLNRDTSDESNDDEEDNPITKEALEQKTQQSYKEALVLQKQNKLQEAEKLLRDLLQSEVLAKSNGKVKFVNGRLQPSLFHLKYCCYLNLGNILFKFGKYSAALESYLKATELDDTDLNLWFKIGTVASKIPNFLFAVYAYSETLRRNARHWPSLDAIITATYVIGDFMACLLYICHSLKLDNSYEKGLVLRDFIFKEHPFLRRDFELFYPDCSSQLNVENAVYTEERCNEIFNEMSHLKADNHSLTSKLEENADQTSIFLERWSKVEKSRSWLCLGKLLLKLYSSVLTDAHDKLFFQPIKLNSLYSHAHLSSEVVSTEILATKFDSHLASEIGEDEAKMKPGRCADELNADEDDEVTHFVNVSIKNNDADRENIDGGNKSKRRKCSPTLADQLKICDKRRSTRNKTVLKSNEPSLSKTLQQLIPQDLLPQKDKISKNNFYDLLRWNEDSFDTMDIYQLLFEHQEQNNIPSYPTNQFDEDIRHKLIREENYFGADPEKKDVDWFVRINSEQTILELFEAYLKDLASKWRYTWPSKLADMYVEMYQRLQKHGFISDHLKFEDISEITNGMTDESVKVVQERLNMVIVYGELLLNQSFDSTEQAQAFGNCAFGGNFSSFVVGDMHDACSLLDPLEKKIEFLMRTYWLEALIFLQKRDIVATCSALSMLIQEIPNSDIEIRLPNVKHFHVISLINARRLLNTLNRNQNLNEIKSLLVGKQYDRVADILRETLTPDCKELMHLPNEPTLSRYEQYNLLLTALWESKNYEELFEWCEICFYEAFVIYRKSFFDEIETETKSHWASLATNTLNCMFSCLKTVGLTIVRVLQSERLSRLVQTLSNLVCHQIEASEPSPEIIADVVTPWILLANLIQTKEDWDGAGKSAESSNETIASSCLSLLFMAHEHLGRRSWCCFNDGALLFYTLNVIEVLYKNCCPAWSEMLTTLSQQSDQIFYCLYSHPFKKNKPRHVQDHNSLGLALTWNRAVQAYSFYRPCTLPTFDAVSKLSSISGDTETLLKRMISLIPENRHPARFVDSVRQYLRGDVDHIPENGNPLPDEVADLFYLLGDYYFKNKIMGEAIRYYLLDICSNPRRIDSWSAMALARGSQLEMKLNSCESISSECDILKKAELTDKCYKTALDLDSTQSTLWIEYGVFCYAVHAFCSRLLKQETTNLSLQMFEMLENRKEKFLNTSYHCFNSANEAWLTLISKHEDVQDERWLHHYMLGKIGEKREEKVESCLNHYYQASDLLFRNGAEYPARILYSSPQYYSVEALEVYYRVHSSILKILETYEEKSLDYSTINVLKLYMEKMAVSPFMRARLKSTSNKSTDKSFKDDGSKKQNSVAQDLNRDVHDVVAEIIDKVVGQTNSTHLSKRRVEDLSSTGPESNPTKKFKGEKNSTVEENDRVDVQEECLLAAVSADEEDGRFKNMKNVPIDTSNLNSPSSDLSSCDSYSDISNIGDDTDVEANNRTLETEAVGLNRQGWQETRQLLIRACIRALEECTRRFPEHYKSFYRLAHHNFRSKLDKDIDKARKLLIDEGGLFADRTSKNFFGGIWRIPTGEIDRPGSFAFHMSRSIHLLMDVLRDTQDYKTLLQLSDQLRCKPDLDKKYLRDNEREQLSKDAFSLGAQALRKTIDRTPCSEKEATKRKLLLDVYKCYLRVSKNHSQKDGLFGRFLRTIYYKYTMRKERVGLEQVLSFCKSVDQMARNEPAENLPSLLEAAIRAESDVPAATAPSDASTQELPTRNPEPKMPPPPPTTTTKVKNSSGVGFAPSIPANLKNLPAAITVTTVPPCSSKSKLCAQPPPHACEKSAAAGQPSRARHCVIVRAGAANGEDGPWPPTAVESTDARKTAASPAPGNKAAYVDSVELVPLPLPLAAPVRDGKSLSASAAAAAAGASPPVDRSSPSVRTFPAARELAAELCGRGGENGLTIVPVPVPAATGADNAANVSRVAVQPAAGCSSAMTGDGAFARLAAVNKQRPGLIITPVRTQTPTPTLQQKLAAKRMANHSSVRLSSAAAANESAARPQLPSSVALPTAKHAVSSGVRVLAAGCGSGSGSGDDEDAAPNRNPNLNRYVSRESEILSHFQQSSSSPSPSPSPSPSLSPSPLHAQPASGAADAVKSDSHSHSQSQSHHSSSSSSSSSPSSSSSSSHSCSSPAASSASTSSSSPSSSSSSSSPSPSPASLPTAN